MNLEALAKKIERLKTNYRDMAKSLSQDFSREAEGNFYNVHICASSYLRDLPILAKEIQILEAVLAELKEQK